MRLRVNKCPTDDLATTNCAVLNAAVVDAKRTKNNTFRHILVKTDISHQYVFTIRNYPSLRNDEIAFSIPQRKWATLSLDQEVEVQPYNFDPSTSCISTIVLTVDFHSKKK
uniref:Vesicle-fusing ATPase n=1 Tax=Syphacia muris TaxID=451379 RepID=A0A0N5AV97_9BILA